MEKIFKKSLAIMVSAAICLTALIGCLTVSAERGEGTITVGTVEGKAGDSVTVPVELKYTSSQENGLGIAAALFDVKFDTNVLTITKIEREDPTNDAIAYMVEWRTTDGDKSSIDVRDGAVRILAVGKDKTAVVPSMSLNLTFTINSGAPAGASNITIENLQACDYGTADINGIYDASNEDMISMSATNGSVTVAEDQTCEHNNLEYVSSVPATEEAEGTITFRCADCTETIVKPVSYYAYYATATATPQYESEVLLSFSAKEDHLSSQGAYSDGFVVLEKENADAEASKYVYTFDEADTTIVDNAKSWSVGLPAKTFTDNITSTVYVEYNGEWYSGIQVTQNLMGYASLIFDAVSGTEKKLIADLANYGAAAQIHFDYNVDNLATEMLTAEQLAFATDGIAEYADDLDNQYDLENDKIFTVAIALSAESKLTINYEFLTNNYVGNLSDLTAQVTFTNAHNELKTFTYTNVDFYTISTNRYGLNFDELAAYDLRKPVTIAFYEKDVKVSCDTVYSAQSMADYANENNYATTEINLYNEMLQYCDSAMNHFIG